MKTINPINQTYIKRSEELAQSRKDIFSEDIKEQIYNFQITHNKPISLMHYLLKQKPEQKILNTAIENYIINLVSLWETACRDLFVTALKLDDSFKEFICSKYMKNYEQSKKINVDIMALAVNFQNLHDLSSAFEYLFETNDLLSYIGMYKQNIVMKPHIIEKFSLDTSFENWQQKFKDAIDLRHNFIHDRNFSYEFTSKEIFELETLFCIVPQLLINIVAEKFNLKRFVVQVEQKKAETFFFGYANFNLIFTIDDIVNGMWEIKESGNNDNLSSLS